MDFMGIGPLELLLIILILFIVLGPEKLPKMARELGRGLRGLRKAWAEFTKEIDKETKEIDKETKDIKKDIQKDMQSTAVKDGDSKDKESKNVE